MKIETSVNLPEEILKAVDNLSGPEGDRSEFIEAAVRAYVSFLERKRQNERDIEIINRNADELNRQAEETLEYQVEW
ncbi:MAG: CopG family ribbon-helix-helix protein [Pyrinomonadaceae bacterium]